MKKQILNIGKALSKAEQKQINGGTRYYCENETCESLNPIIINGIGSRDECCAYDIHLTYWDGNICWQC